jgi:hypothetical protein
VIQGPHIVNAQPFAQSPRGGSNKDWDDIDLETLANDFLPRTQYLLQKPLSQCTTGVPRLNGRPYAEYPREAHREFVPTNGVRTLQSCLIPPAQRRSMRSTRLSRATRMKR